MPITLEAVTHGRLIMEKIYYLNASNSKHVKIGIKPASKLFNKELTGFFVEVIIDGQKMKPMSLGGIDGFMNVCSSLRTFDELRYTYPDSAEKYDEMENPLPINITKKNMGGTVCFCFETVNGDNAMIAQNSLQDLLKYECLIGSAIRKLQTMVDDVEKKFSDLVAKASDLTAALDEAVKSGDLLTIEIITNFNELFKICADEATRFSSPSGSAVATAVPRRKRNATPKKPMQRNVKKAKTSEAVDNSTADNGQAEVSESNEAGDHNYASSVEETELIEIIETSEKEPLGLHEDGQRMESEHYI